MSIVSESLQSYLLLAVAVVIAFVLAKLGVRLVIRGLKKLESRGTLSPSLVEFSGAILRVLIW